MTANEETVPSGLPLFRNPSLTHAEFCKHWLENHAALVTPYFLKGGSIIEYTQIHLPEPRDRVGSIDAKEKLRPFDGVGFLKRKTEPHQGTTIQGYYDNVILPDERRFLHEESGSSPVEKVPPTVEILPLGIAKWRELALEVGGVEYTIIQNGKLVITFPEGAFEVWRRWDTGFEAEK